MRRGLVVRAAVLGAMIILAVAGFVSPVAAQSGGCVGGPFEGATPTDSDGDGVSDADEVVAGTDECDPTDVPTTETGEGTGVTESEDPPTNTASQPPTLALTGPSVAMIISFLGILLVTLGGASLLIGRRIEA